MPTITTSTQCHIRGPKMCQKTRKRDNKRHKDSKERKLSLLTNDLIVYLENLKESTSKPVTHEFS